MFPKTEVKASSSPPAGGRHMGRKSHPLWSSDRTNWKTQSVCVCCDFTTLKSVKLEEKKHQAIKYYTIDVMLLSYLVVIVDYY